MANTFSATDLETTKGNVEAKVSEIIQKTSELGSITSNISGLVAAGSSYLAGSWSEISNTYEQIGSSIEASVQELLSEMATYSANTVSNETTNDSKLVQTNESLDNLNNQLSNL